MRVAKKATLFFYKFNSTIMIKRTLCFTNPAYLSLKNEQLVVKIPDSMSESESVSKSTTTIPIEDIGVVVIDNRQITITSGVIDALLANNCALITCDGKSLPVGLMLPLCGNTTQSERFRYQIEATLPLKKQLWQQTVQAKINNQAKVLSKCTDAETACMKVWSKEVKSGDSDNLEGRSAAYYWKKLFGHIADFNRDIWAALQRSSQRNVRSLEFFT
ncbi:MAG: type II CRISPR-associated endonuclease Cas1 [Peptococcaceae bacterium]|nr:type II CRISPR-associated endonuclease Cas1 [Peptococcaceae bacterium]